MAIPKVRKRVNAQRKARYHANKDEITARNRERYASDTEYRKNKLFVNDRAARSRKEQTT